MRLAHVRERHGPAGAPWRLAAALDDGTPTRWLDLELARRRLVAARPARAHDAALHRQPVTTLDDLLARGLRVEALRELVDGFQPRGDDDEAVGQGADLVFGAPLLRPAVAARFYGFEGHVRTMWERRGGEVPEAWYRLPSSISATCPRSADRATRVGAGGSDELDYELEVAALIDTPARRPVARSGRGGDRRLHDLQRLVGARPPAGRDGVRLGPAKGKDFASSFGPWLVTPDELADARSDRGYDLAMTASVNGIETSRGRWADAQFSVWRTCSRGRPRTPGSDPAT